MTNRHVNMLFKRHKNLFARLIWGFEVGDGWFKIIAALSKKLAQDKRIEIYQIKEKFGRLRVYYSPFTDEAEMLVKVAERLCSKTCEVCGELGSLNKRGWLSVLCPKCRERHEDKA